MKTAPGQHTEGEEKEGTRRDDRQQHKNTRKKTGTWKLGECKKNGTVSVGKQELIRLREKGDKKTPK